MLICWSEKKKLRTNGNVINNYLKSLNFLWACLSPTSWIFLPLFPRLSSAPNFLFISIWSTRREYVASACSSIFFSTHSLSALLFPFHGLNFLLYLWAVPQTPPLQFLSHMSLFVWCGPEHICHEGENTPSLWTRKLPWTNIGKFGP